MKRLILLLICFSILTIPVSASQITAPEVPESGQNFLRDRPKTFSEGLHSIIREAIAALRPDLIHAGGICLAVFVVTMLLSLFHSFEGSNKRVLVIIGVLTISSLFFSTATGLIGKGAATVTEISTYGKLLLPSMTAALAAQGGITASTALYTATAMFDTLLVTLISNIMVPMVYIFLALAIANAATGDELIKKVKDLTKWLVTWVLKTLLIIFTGYISITGVVSGSTDAAALKAAKLTISGTVPVVGGILSDASEAVLVGTEVMKNAAGIYGFLAIIALLIGPAIEIGIQNMLLKATAALSDIFGIKEISGLTSDFSDAMGILLAMTCSGALAMLISIICFMKGVS